MVSDIRPANILTRLNNIKDLPEAELPAVTGPPKTISVIRVSQDSTSAWPSTAPRYLVRPLSWNLLGHQTRNILSENICVTHFGESFDMNDPSEDMGIPQEYRSPEYILDKRVGAESDTWALGCILFEIRTGRRLFSPSHDDPDEHLAQMVAVLGKLPEPWWSTTWEFRKRWFADERDANGRPISVAQGMNGTQSPRLSGTLGSLDEMISLAIIRHPKQGDHGRISDRETALFTDLLKKIFRYVPEQRITAEEMLDHPWFSI